MAAGRAAATETEPPAQGTAGAQGSARRCGARQAARGRLCAEGTCAAGAASGEGWHARSEATRAGVPLGRDGRARESQCRACCYGEAGVQACCSYTRTRAATSCATRQKRILFSRKRDGGSGATPVRVAHLPRAKSCCGTVDHREERVGRSQASKRHFLPLLAPARDPPHARWRVPLRRLGGFRSCYFRTCRGVGMRR